MSVTATPEVSFADKHHFLLRRLHSLSGIVPIGAFLVEHLLTNSRAFDWFGWFSGGREEFNKDVHWIHGFPYLLAIEITFIFAPLAFHAIYGLFIAMSAEPNYGRYKYGSNLRYSLQRISGYVALVFIVVHLCKYRFAHWFGGDNFIGSADPYELTRMGLHNWSIMGVTMPAGVTFGLYLVGLAATVFHFANGIWTFCISWGITVGAAAQRRMGYVAATVGVVLMVWGSASLLAFWRDDAPTAHTKHGEPTPGRMLTQPDKH